MQFSRAAVFYNPDKPQNAPLAQKVCDLLRANGLTTDLLTDLDQLSEHDLLVSMGGDGTILHCARATAPKQIPIFGINCGTLGFLAATEKDRLEQDLTALLQGKCVLHKRLMIAAQVENQTYYAFNDCVLRTDESRAFETRAVWNEAELPSYYGDGVIVASPTGSTAYSLAAGGPIIEPSVPVFTLTPVCPHSFYQRPLVIPAQGVLTLSPVLKADSTKAFISLDGQKNVSVARGKSVVITRSPYDAQLLCLPGRYFFAILHRKLHWGN